ncbi:hypothetical protein G6M89_08775 [Natronolimnobius sp. AArcel1]|uniref:hypothetical protein n=1 Tax=Natronolimnobius sp. AArcel1 TaxID=1679093 RepID=UPI0013E9D8EE|nr:hypothetical protein [Natronolimnobius sp. AArcel1]NGM69099.1 hypothetical protein [Natronolimnobius sp. AArcel1]
MSTVYLADSGVFIRCGGPDRDKYQRLRRAVRTAGITLYVPRRVYEELGGEPSDEAYPTSSMPWQEGIEEGWIVVADPLEYTNPIVSGIMDATRRFIANETGRSQDIVEKADTALVGLAAQFLESEADQIVLLTTDKPAGRAAETLLPEYGFEERLEYRYVSEAYLQNITANEFLE